MFDGSFGITDDPSALMYYRVPHGNVEQYNTFEMVMYSGHFTSSFIQAMGYDTVTSERFVWNDSELYFKTEFYTEDYSVFTCIDSEPHMTGEDSCYVLVNKTTAEGTDLGTYKLSFVYESVITADTFIWKMDSLTNV